MSSFHVMFISDGSTISLGALIVCTQRWISSCPRDWMCRAIETGHGETLSPLNPMGVKGAGEAGAIPVGPLFAQALEDALYDVDFEILEIPLNSNRLWELTNKRLETGE